MPATNKKNDSKKRTLSKEAKKELGIGKRRKQNIKAPVYRRMMRMSGHRTIARAIPGVMNKVMHDDLLLLLKTVTQLARNSKKKTITGEHVKHAQKMLNQTQIV